MKSEVLGRRFIDQDEPHTIIWIGDECFIVALTILHYLHFGRVNQYALEIKELNEALDRKRAELWDEVSARRKQAREAG